MRVSCALSDRYSPLLYITCQDGDEAFPHDYSAARLPGLVRSTRLGSAHAPAVGSILLGLQMFVGLNASRRRIIIARSSGVNSFGMRSSFSTPMPCSPVTLPPKRIHSFR